ncbi:MULTISPECIES: AI-2E family transporter [unclassified Spirosoma]|uniref:AI-2E family transporter n=1 Tax=unclassified Spirosoma TaxID=2621999 RepID=UPI00095CA1A1|nr:MULTISPECIES: AI-2E family transporter [unclassified Spirosoma]MBN8822582.1 AI-2E family transporter [Spirosoma sp.]OJW74077.1 MAG: AI-2E family transporter [Spirosoma sp. 48-14]
MNSIYTPQQQRILLIASLLIIAGFILFGLSGYTTAFLGAGILYVVFRPWFTALAIKRNWNRSLVASLLIVFSLVVIIMPFLTLSLLLIDRIQYYSQHTEVILNLVKKLEELTGYKITSQQNIQTILRQGGTYASRLLPSIAGGALDFIVIIGLMLFTLYFMFVQQESFQKGLQKYLPFKRDTQKELAESLKNNVNANVLGQALVSLVQGVLTGLTLWIFGVPDSLFWGTVAFFMAFIPVLGTPLVWAPAGLIQLSQGNTGQGVGILLVGVIVIINIDNLLRIMLAKRMGDIHPLVTLAGIVLGVPIFGIIGLVIGPLLVSYFIVLIQVFERENKKQEKEAALAEERLEKAAEKSERAKE